MSDTDALLGNYTDRIAELSRENAELRKQLEQAEKVEREECAKVCERQLTDGDHRYLIAHGHYDFMAQASLNCAALIRERSNKTTEQKEPT